LEIFSYLIYCTIEKDREWRIDYKVTGLSRRHIPVTGSLAQVMQMEVSGMWSKPLCSQSWPPYPLLTVLETRVNRACNNQQEPPSLQFFTSPQAGERDVAGRPELQL
jgi:hypothetical protein